MTLSVRCSIDFRNGFAEGSCVIEPNAIRFEYSGVFGVYDTIYWDELSESPYEQSGTGELGLLEVRTIEFLRTKSWRPATIKVLLTTDEVIRFSLWDEELSEHVERAVALFQRSLSDSA